MKRLIILFTLAAFSLPVHAQSDEGLRFTFNHVALSVTDLDQSVNLYRSVLDFEEITNRTGKEGIRWFKLGEDKELHLISVIDGPVQLNKAVHFAISTADFDAFVARLNTNNVPYSDWAGSDNTITVRADGVRQVYVQDPDGYWIEVNGAPE